MPHTKITLLNHPKQGAHTTFEIVDDQAVVINLQAGTYISLNETGSFLWERLDGETTLESIAQELAEAYDVSPEITRPDVLALAQELQREGFVDL